MQLIREHSVDLGEKGADDMFGNGLVNVRELMKIS